MGTIPSVRLSMNPAFGSRNVGSQGLGDSSRQCRQAFSTLCLCAEFVVIHHIVQTGHAIGESLFLVLLEKELGVRQTWPHHAFIALNDVPGIVRRQVRHNQEP